MTKTTSGTATLSGVNTYTGATTVNGGTLLVNGSLASGSAVSVNNSGTVLGGTGTIGGTVSVGSGAILRGGDGSAPSGSLSIAGAVTLAAGSIIELALGAPGAHSTLAGNGFTFAMAQAFHFLDFGAAPGFYDNIITGLTGVPNTSPSTWTITNGGWTGTFVYDGSGDIDLTLTAVPEPSTWIAGALVVGVLGWTQRRRLGHLVRRTA